LSDVFKIAETETFQHSMSRPEFQKLYEKITTFIYPQLRSNPFFGPNIKKLKGTLYGLYRYRIGRYRLFYRIDEQKIIIYILDIYDRKNSY